MEKAPFPIPLPAIVFGFCQKGNIETQKQD